MKEKYFLKDFLRCLVVSGKSISCYIYCFPVSWREGCKFTAVVARDIGPSVNRTTGDYEVNFGTKRIQSLNLKYFLHGPLPLQKLKIKR